MAQVPNKIAVFGNRQVLSVADNFLQVGPIRDLDDAPIDLSAWESLQCFAFDPNTDGDANYSTQVGTVTGQADGDIIIKLAATEFPNTLLNGKTYGFLVKGRVLATDAYQALGTGQLQVLKAFQ